jgi:hypothetical protein
MAAVGLAEYDKMLKILYPDGEVESAALHDTVFANRVNKVADFYGKELDWPLPYANGAGRSAIFATAQANASSPQYAGWVLKRKRDFVVWQVDLETLHASEKDRGAFVAAQKNLADMHLAEIGRSFSVGLYGVGGGSLGVVAAAGITGSTATLTFAHDSRNFYPGQKIDVSATGDSTATPRAGSPLTVQSVSYTAGTVTFTAGIVATVGGAIPGDFLIQQGDDGAKISGLAGWIPLTPPTATPFNGVDRSKDIERLAGWRVNNAVGDIGDNLITLGQLVAMGRPGKNQIVLINPINFGTIVKSLGSKIIYQRIGVDEKSAKFLLGGTGVMVGLSSGMCEVVVDPDCPGGVGYLLDEDTWHFHSLREVPHLVTEDGRDSLRGATSDTIEVRARYWGDLLCTNPHKNGVFACAS